MTVGEEIISGKTVSRRNVLKNSGHAIGAIGLTGLMSSQRAAASHYRRLEVKTGTGNAQYRVRVNTTDVYSEHTEGADGIHKKGDHSVLEGTIAVTGQGKDVYRFTGTVDEIYITDITSTARGNVIFALGDGGRSSPLKDTITISADVNEQLQYTLQTTKGIHKGDHADGNDSKVKSNRVSGQVTNFKDSYTTAGIISGCVIEIPKNGVSLNFD
jgi:hypothetical protein